MKNKSIKILVLLIGFIIFTLLIGKTSVYGHRELEDPRTYDKPINAISLCNTQISLSKSQYNYTGTECKPSVTVTYYGSIVDSSKYTVQYKNNINIGTATVVVSAISGSGYKGSNSKSFNISKNSLSNFTISLSQSAYTYDGTPKKPTVTVKYQNRVIPSSNYSVSYYDYINPGTGKVTISGKNNLSGTVNKTFKITKRPIANCDITLSRTKFEYDGGAKIPNVIIKHNNKVLTKDQINSYDYNGCAGLTAILDRVDEGHEIWTKMNPYETDLQVGDIVFFSWNGDLEPEHVSIYAGNGQWYDAGSTDAIQTSTIQLNMNGTMTTLYRLNK